MVRAVTTIGLLYYLEQGAGHSNLPRSPGEGGGPLSGEGGLFLGGQFLQLEQYREQATNTSSSATSFLKLSQDGGRGASDKERKKTPTCEKKRHQGKKRQSRDSSGVEFTEICVKNGSNVEWKSEKEHQKMLRANKRDAKKVAKQLAYVEQHHAGKKRIRVGDGSNAAGSDKDRVLKVTSDSDPLLMGEKRGQDIAAARMSLKSDRSLDDDLLAQAEEEIAKADRVTAAREGRRRGLPRADGNGYAKRHNFRLESEPPYGIKHGLPAAIGPLTKLPPEMHKLQKRLDDRSGRAAFHPLGRSASFPPRSFLETSLDRVGRYLRYNAGASASGATRYDLWTEHAYDPWMEHAFWAFAFVAACMLLLAVLCVATGSAKKVMAHAANEKFPRETVDDPFASRCEGYKAQNERTVDDLFASSCCDGSIAQNDAVDTCKQGTSGAAGCHASMDPGKKFLAHAANDKTPLKNVDPNFVSPYAGYCGGGQNKAADKCRKHVSTLADAASVHDMGSSGTVSRHIGIGAAM
ncbi:unnamed protein product [Amoebophrya sp. A25]|nr:unnamed protein product [Amoebophrya sp. A25]|eukprot:GSA25T00020981001.1